MIITEIFSDLWDVLFPQVCFACDEPLTKGEHVICINCQLELPKTDYLHFIDNPVAEKFWGKISIDYATAFYHFNKSSKVQHLLHALKYKGQKEIGIKLGQLFGYQLSEHAVYSTIDIITSVPLHKKKEAKRGYNQSDLICEGISMAMHKPFDKNIVERIKFTDTQTKKGKIERWENVKDIFRVIDMEKIKNKRILLVDDIITTGSTIEACATELAKAENIKLCIGCIAHAEF